AGTRAQGAPPYEVHERPPVDRETYAVERAEQRRDLAGQCAVDQGLQEDGLGPVFALVHRDELAEDGIRTLTARTPSLDAADESFGAAPERGIDKLLLCRHVEVDGSRGNVGAPRHFAHAHLGVPAARDLAQCGGLDRRRCSRGLSSAIALHVAARINCKSSVAESKVTLDGGRDGRYRCTSSGESRVRVSRAWLDDCLLGPSGLRAVRARPRDIRRGGSHRWV